MIYQPRIEQSDWSEVTSHGTTDAISRAENSGGVSSIMHHL